MAKNEPTLEQWGRLHDLAAKLRALAPWNWMDAADLMAIEDPASGTTFYSSVLGAADDVLAIVAYVGAEGLASFRKMFNRDTPDASTEDIYRQHVHALYFSDRAELQSEDLTILRKLRTSGKGDRPWPQFRIHRPGRPAARQDAAEAEQFATVLEQVIELVVRAETDRSFLAPRDGGGIITRVADLDVDGRITGWHDEWKTPAVPEPAATPLANVIDIGWQQIARKVKGRSLGIWEVGVIVLPMVVTGEPEGPLVPFGCLAVEVSTGHIFDLQVLPHDLAHRELAPMLVGIIERLGQKPAGIHVETVEAADAIRSFCALFDIKLVVIEKFAELHNARQAIQAHFGGGQPAIAGDAGLVLDPLAAADIPDDLAGMVSEGTRKNMEKIIELTDAFCEQHLDEEYARLCRKMVFTIGSIDPSPLDRGRLDIWACGITYALGSINFLFDRSQKPHLSAQDLCRLYGVSASSASAKSRSILDNLDIRQLDPEWSRKSLIESSPLTWMIQIEGLVVDARELPEEYQLSLYESGTLPFPPWAALCDTLAMSVPFTLLPTAGLIAAMAEQGVKIRPSIPLTVTEVEFGGDASGITCIIELPKEKQVLAVSLTALEPPAGSRFADDIRLYQKRRAAGFELEKLLDSLAREREQRSKSSKGGVKPRGKKKK